MIKNSTSDDDDDASVILEAMMYWWCNCTCTHHKGGERGCHARVACCAPAAICTNIKHQRERERVYGASALLYSFLGVKEKPNQQIFLVYTILPHNPAIATCCFRFTGTHDGNVWHTLRHDDMMIVMMLFVGAYLATPYGQLTKVTRTDVLFCYKTMGSKQDTVMH